MGNRSALLVAGIMILASPVAWAGPWDDLKGAVSGAREIVDDVRQTRDETKGVVGDAKGVVDETSEDVESALPEADTKPAAPPPPPSASPPPPPPPSAKTWHLDAGGGETRAVNEAELAELIAAGRVGPETPVYGEGLSEWTALGKVPALSRYLSR